MFVISKVSIHRFFCLCKFFINSQRIVPYFLDTTTWSLCHWFLSLAIRIILKRLISKAILLMEWILHQWTWWISHSLQWFDNQVVSLMQLPSTVSCAPWWNCWLPKHLKIALHWVWFTVNWRSWVSEIINFNYLRLWIFKFTVVMCDFGATSRWKKLETLLVLCANWGTKKPSAWFISMLWWKTDRGFWKAESPKNVL